MLEGLPPNGAAFLMRLRCDEGVARRAADAVVETFEPAETAAAAFEQPDASWVVDIFFHRPEDENRIRGLLALVIGEGAVADDEVLSLREADWVAASLAGLDAVREGRFVVHGAHGRNRVKAGDIGIEIEAALAFGTGHHGTTRGCLAMIAEVARKRRPKRIVDLGTGTGVLAIAAARRFRTEVFAGDVDPIAVSTARENAIKNGAAMLIRPVRAAGLDHPSLRGGAYDLVFANILARPLRALARPIRENLARGGDVILSGLLAGDVPGVLASYRAQGLTLIRRRDIEGWATLLMRRPVSSA